MDANSPAAARPLRTAWFYDMDACRGATGVTRHALAQLEKLAVRPDVALQLVSGRISDPDGLIVWDRWAERVPRRELPLRTRELLRLWRITQFPALELWTGPLDWIYAPAELLVPTRGARRAVTSHDALQDIRYGSPRRKLFLDRLFHAADLVLSVSEFNSRQLLEHFPQTKGKVALVPNGADDLFFEPASALERGAVRADLGLRPGRRYLLSVANFQERKNLPMLVQGACRLAEVASGELAIVLIGAGDEAQADRIRQAAATSPKACLVMAGYRQGVALRALYAEAAALVFASQCESFGIPTVEAMAQGCPVALADSTALPEVGGDAGWYFAPESPEAIAASLRELLDCDETRAERVRLGRERAEHFRWQRSNDALVAALRSRTF